MRARGLRVLLTGSAEGLARPLREEGHQIDLGADSASALLSARTHSLDVVVVDLKCADAPGAKDPFELARLLRAAAYWRKPFFIGLADRTSPRCEKCCREAGIDLLLLEPVQPGLVRDFLGRLRDVVDDYESFDPVI